MKMLSNVRMARNKEGTVHMKPILVQNFLLISSYRSCHGLFWILHSDRVEHRLHSILDFRIPTTVFHQRMLYSVKYTDEALNSIPYTVVYMFLLQGRPDLDCHGNIHNYLFSALVYMDKDRILLQDPIPIYSLVYRLLHIWGGNSHRLHVET